MAFTYATTVSVNRTQWLRSTQYHTLILGVLLFLKKSKMQREREREFLGAHLFYDKINRIRQTPIGLFKLPLLLSALHSMALIHSIHWNHKRWIMTFHPFQFLKETRIDTAYKWTALTIISPWWTAIVNRRSTFVEFFWRLMTRQHSNNSR